MSSTTDLSLYPARSKVAGGVMHGSPGGVDLAHGDIPRVRNHLARYYQKMGDTLPCED